MRIINNRYIPVRGYRAINIMGFVFCRKGTILNSVERNHMKIHTQQMKELLYVFWYLIYAFDYLFMWIGSGRSHFLAKKCVAFEMEANFNEKDANYLRRRKRYSWIKHIF